MKIEGSMAVGGVQCIAMVHSRQRWRKEGRMNSQTGGQNEGGREESRENAGEKPSGPNLPLVKLAYEHQRVDSLHILQTLLHHPKHSANARVPVALNP